MLDLHRHLKPDTRDLSDSAEIMALYGRFIGERNVNAGCALNHIVGPGKWTNVDSNMLCQPDLLCDLRDLVSRLGHNQVDCVFASHVLEHLSCQDLFAAFDQFWQILRPGGYVLAFVPHGAYDVAWEDPFHLTRFSVVTFAYLCSHMYTEPGNAGYGAGQGTVTHPWSIVGVAQVPTDEWKGKSDDEIAEASSRYRNVIKEIHCVMRKELGS